jgi:hypothetical protein
MIAANDAPYVKRQVARGRGRALLRITCAFLVGLFLVRSADAQDQAKTQEAINKTQAKLSVCIAYFSIFKECSAGDEKDLSLADLAINGLGKKSHAAANAVGMSSDDIALRLDLNLESQRQLIGSCSGMTVLLSRYSRQCNDLVLGADRSSK